MGFESLSLIVLTSHRDLVLDEYKGSILKVLGHTIVKTMCTIICLHFKKDSVHSVFPYEFKINLDMWAPR